jgi:peroxiredoxin
VRVRRIVVASAGAALAIAALAGCTESPAISSDGNNTGYVSGSGVYKEIPPTERKDAAASFTAPLDDGGTISSKSLLGKVHVLNFWYSTCGPCRVEAKQLEKAYTHYKGSVPFLGVNTYDQAPQAVQFEKAHGVTYPSVIDTNTAAVQYSYSKFVSPDAVPVTLVIDKHGRVAARVTGELETSTILTSLVDRVIAEGQ